MDEPSKHASPSPKTRARGAASDASTRSTQQDIHLRSNGVRPPQGPQSSLSTSIEAVTRRSQTPATMTSAATEGGDVATETPCRTSSAYILLQLRDLGRTSSGTDGALTANRGASITLPSSTASPASPASSLGKQESASVAAPKPTNETPGGQKSSGPRPSRREQNPTGSSGGSKSRGTGTDSTNSMKVDAKGKVEETKAGFAQGVAAGVLEGAVAAAAAIERGMYVAGLLPGFHGAATHGAPCPGGAPISSMQQPTQPARSGRPGRPPSTGVAAVAAMGRPQGRTQTRSPVSGAQARSSTRTSGGKSSSLPSTAGGTVLQGTSPSAGVGVSGGLRPICPKGGPTEPLVISPATGQLVPVRVPPSLTISLVSTCRLVSVVGSSSRGPFPVPQSSQKGKEPYPSPSN